ncbi:MAG: MBL fold metallo-hydrolase [Taibaiella sp.]|nr:MBL fold metallo-hydrolase [Taibaiella sp.]
MQQFGKAPGGERLERLKQSPNYRDGAFQNLNHTPPLKEGVSYYEVFRKFFFGKSKRVQPGLPVPTIKSELKSIPAVDDVIVWFGHSSYFMQLSGVRILVDPVFSGNASPVSFTTKSFPGADVYTVDDMPQIDYLFISHDHYDHLDYKTVKALKPKVNRVITGLGVGSHLEHWGYDKVIITERDWHDTVFLEDGFTVTYAPSRHFSGRGLKRNGTLWTSFILQTPQRRIYLGGDSGYDDHFAAIGNQHGPFDLAILEDGQYNEYWKYIHMMPEEVVQAAMDLKAKTLFPVHWSKFALSIHDWDEPIKRVVTAAAASEMPLVHPRIGRIVNMDDMQVHNEQWWTSIV